MSALESGVASVAVASGTAAISMTMMALASSGDNFVSASTVQGGTLHLFSKLGAQFGLQCHLVATNNAEDYAALIDEKTKFIFVESISNPKGEVPDISALAAVASLHGVPLIVSQEPSLPLNTASWM
jgi:O-acetylhomoserine/O-acetylserine sulfhydrylase-like pyridoxal-dependent enzyme